MKSFILIFISLAVAAIVLHEVKGVPTDGKPLNSSIEEQCCSGPGGCRCGWCLSCPLEKGALPKAFSKGTGLVSIAEAMEIDQSVTISHKDESSLTGGGEILCQYCCCGGWCISC